MFLNEATLLHNLKIRYQKDKIYVRSLKIIEPYNSTLAYHKCMLEIDTYSLSWKEADMVTWLTWYVIIMVTESINDTLRMKSFQSIMQNILL